MRFRDGAALLGAMILLVGCSTPDGTSGSSSSASLNTADQKASYGIGLNVGAQIVDTKDRLDRPAFMRGIEDALRGNEPALTRQELQPVLQAFAAEIQAEASAGREAEATENAEAGAAYLAENGARDGVTTTASGLQYEVLRAADGAMPSADDRVRLHYRGTLIDGTEFDSSYGGEPAEFGVGGVIPGFSEALQLMPVGSHFRVVIPSDIAYGPPGAGGDIGPDATLIFEIELLEIVGS